MRFTAIGRRAVLLGSIACLGAGAPPDTVLPVETTNGRCVAAVTLDGRKARMLLDTGAERTVVTRAAVRRLGLRFDPWVDTTLRGAGGVLETHPNADVRSATMGGVTLFQRLGENGLSLSVTSVDLDGVDGLLGGDVLRHYTLDLDFSRARLMLHPAQQEGADAGAVQLQLLRHDLLLAPVRLDGHDLIALLDTGASESLVNARGLYQLGLTPKRLSRDRIVSTMGLGGELETHAHRFAELQIGSLILPEPVMLAAAVPEIAYDLTLGMDVLGRQRLVLSYTSLTLVLTPA